jgi:hypothetical protein
MDKIYQVVVKVLNELPQDKEIELAIRDLTAGTRKYDGRYVKAMVSSSSTKYADAKIRMISSVGYIYPDQWSMKIVREVGPYPTQC